MDYKKTLENSIKRKSKFIDEKVQYFKDIPLFSWIEISPIDACNRKCVFCPKSASLNEILKVFRKPFTKAETGPFPVSTKENSSP